MTFDPNCTFCNIVRGSESAHVVYEDAQCLAFLDIAPAAEGHTLVIPRTHVRTILDVSPSIAGDLMSCATRVAHIIDKTFHCDGMTLIQTNEIAGGQTVFHMHLHIVPRWSADELLPPWGATRIPDDVLSATRLKMVSG
jgi:histidine triad (HIT) family protein